MNNYNIQMQNALDGNYVTIDLQMPCELDKIAIRVMKENWPDFLLRFSMMDMNNEITLKYKIPNAVSLKYMSESFTKQMFLTFYGGLLEPFIKGYDWFLDYHYICIITDYIYIDKRTAKPSFLYIPEKSYRNTDEEIADFFKDALSKVTVTDDSAFLIQLYQYFNSGNVVISELYNMIKEQTDKITPANEFSNHIPPKPELNVAPMPEINQAAFNQIPHTVPNSNPMRNVEVSPNSAPNIAAAPNQQGSSNAFETSDDDMMNALFGSSSKKKEKQPKVKKQNDKKGKSVKKEKIDKKDEKGLFGGGIFGKKNTKAEPASQPYNQSVNQTDNKQYQQPVNQMYQQPQARPYMAAPVNDESSVTMIEGAGYQMEKCLDLIESAMAGAIARISLDFPGQYIIIGRESGDAVQPDIRFNKSFKQISRMHLRIEREADDYYAIDLGSGNHTLLDGQMMMPNMRYKLNTGAVLSIAANMPARYRVNI